MIYLPEEIWSKIYIYSVIVDQKRKKLLTEIRKEFYKRKIEKVYEVFWHRDDYGEYWNWLHNDIYGWMNDNKATFYAITNKMKNIYKREFNIEVNNSHDINKFEEKFIPTNAINNWQHGKILWNVYSDILTEEEFLNFIHCTTKIEQKSFLDYIHD